MEKESVKVLRECIDLQLKKSNDYQNPNSNIRQADYYPNGCQSIFDSMHSKVLRMRSVMEAMNNDPNYKPNFESLEDSARDLINYASFFVAYMRGGIDGQREDRDWLNKPCAPIRYETNHVLPISTLTKNELNTTLPTCINISTSSDSYTGTMVGGCSFEANPDITTYTTTLYNK